MFGSSDKEARRNVELAILKALRRGDSVYEMLAAVNFEVHHAAYELGDDARFQEEIQCPFDSIEYGYKLPSKSLAEMWMSGSHDLARVDVELFNRWTTSDGFPFFGVGSDTYRRNGWEYAPGWIYVMKCGPHYKIGMSKRPNERCAELSTKPPFDIELLHTFPADNAYQAEQTLHMSYAEYRKNGEWFGLPQEKVTHLCKLGAYVAGIFYTWPDPP